MPIELEIQVSPEEGFADDILINRISKKINVHEEEIQKFFIRKKSIDARGKSININMKVLVYFRDEDVIEREFIKPVYMDVSKAKEVIIIGSGPAGLFSALKMIELGLKPIVIERGKNVRDRRRDLKIINTEHIVDEDSNYCFGEGGAGTYSDGKLYTRSKKRGDIDKTLQLLVYYGASEDILIESHPHIGTNKFPKIIENIRNKIIEYGGKVLFQRRVIDILIKDNSVRGVELSNGEIINCDSIVLATGHSARDIYELLYKKGIFIEAKPFAVGVRVEHSQQLIDKIQYSREDRGIYLPPSSYSIVRQVNGRGIYSFCMCPGGVIAPCATSKEEVVTNGWSPSKRNQKTANSGIVVELKIEDLKKYEKYGALAGMEFQREIERKAWEIAGRTQRVPAQRMIDFVEKRVSANISKTSYLPGTKSVELGEVFPDFITDTLRKGFVEFGKIMKGYFTNEAILHAPESRTSSPVRITRDKYTLEHVQIKGLYPCGEGAGYAGGIISSAIDGEKIAIKCFERNIYK